MPVESGVDGIEDLNPSWPLGADPKSQGDDHIRNCKAAVQGSFPNMNGPNNIGSTLAVSDPVSASDAVTKQYLDAKLIPTEGGEIEGATGVPISQFGTYSVNRVQAGVYDITFNTGPDLQLMLVSTYSNSPEAPGVSYLRLSKFVYRVITHIVYAGGNPGYIDSTFSFARFTW